MRGFFISFCLLSAPLMAQETAVPTDLQNDRDFQFVSKVLRVGNDEDVIERLALSWEHMKRTLARLRPSLEQFMGIQGSAVHQLVSTGRELSLAIALAAGAGGVVEIGVGYNKRGLRIAPHLRFGVRFLGSDPDMDRVSLVGAAMLIFRSFRSQNPNMITLDENTNDHRGGFVGVGGFSNEMKSEMNEVGLGVGIGGFSWRSTVRGFGILLSPGMPSAEMFLVKNLQTILNGIISDLHFFRIAQANQKVEQFEQKLGELIQGLRGRWLHSPSSQGIANHPLSSIQNLFEPSLVETSMRKCSSLLVALSKKQKELK
jgi:hypothetical protein